ncbi:MAG TPA: DUF5004 domain-containing protein [Flavisolibacter sp.]|jgi:hypothetical protein|nr:DUF5004 domain-containing protein [Flavisolibacter sp.]
MRQLSTFSALAISMLLVFSSCQKSDVIRDERSLDGTWLVTGIRSDRAYDFDGDGRTETDIYGGYNSCQRDIVIVFNDDGYGRMRQGCNAYWENITWRLSNNNRQLDIQLPGDQLNLAISQFDTYTIRGVDQVFIDGSSFQITYTLQRQ